MNMAIGSYIHHFGVKGGGVLYYSFRDTFRKTRGKHFSSITL